MEVKKGKLLAHLNTGTAKKKKISNHLRFKKQLAAGQLVRTPASSLEKKKTEM